MGRIGGQEVRFRVDNAPAWPTEKVPACRKELLDLKNGTGHVPDTFSPSLRAGIRNANLMTLVASAHRQDLDVQEYLTDVITQINRGTAKPEELLPDVWKRSHPEAVRTYRVEERRDKADRAQLKAARGCLAEPSQPA